MKFEDLDEKTLGKEISKMKVDLDKNAQLKLADEMESKMNKEQKYIYDRVKNLFKNF